MNSTFRAIGNTITQNYKTKLEINALGCAQLLNECFTSYIIEFAKVYPKDKKGKRQTIILQKLNKLFLKGQKSCNSTVQDPGSFKAIVIND